MYIKQVCIKALSFTYAYDFKLAFTTEIPFDKKIIDSIIGLVLRIAKILTMCLLKIINENDPFDFFSTTFHVYQSLSF